MNLSLPRNAWPEADRTMWDGLRKESGPLDEPGALSHVRSTTCKSLEGRYKRWMMWLSTADPDALALSPAARASVPRLQAWLKALAHLRPMTRLAFVDGVLRVLRAADPDQDWTIQRRLLKSLKRAAGRGDPTRKQGRILSSAVLLKTGLSHAASDPASVPSLLTRMLNQRDGTMIALLSVLPMRRRAFCELTLGTSVQVTPTDITILLSPEMTKTGVAWDVVVPKQVEAPFRYYIEDIRPALLARGGVQHDVLWVGKKGEIIGQEYVGTRIAKVTLKLTGKRVSPHLFRDAAATTLSRLSPESARLISPVLAHSSSATAERHYIHARTIDAGRDYATLVQRLRGV
jgi:integrase